MRECLDTPDQGSCENFWGCAGATCVSYLRLQMGGFHMSLMLCFPSTALKGKYLGLFQLYSNRYFTVSAELSVRSEFSALGFTGSLYALMQ